MIQETTQVLQVLHQVAKEQRSNLTFLDVETGIIKSLVENHCQWFRDGPDMYKFQFMCGQLSQLAMLKLNITRDVMHYHDSLNATIDGSHVKSDDFLMHENERINKELIDLDKSFKRLKKQLLTLKRSFAIQPVHKNQC